MTSLTVFLLGSLVQNLLVECAIFHGNETSNSTVPAGVWLAKFIPLHEAAQSVNSPSYATFTTDQNFTEIFITFDENSFKNKSTSSPAPSLPPSHSYPDSAPSNLPNPYEYLSRHMNYTTQTVFTRPFQNVFQKNLCKVQHPFYGRNCYQPHSYRNCDCCLCSNVPQQPISTSNDGIPVAIRPNGDRIYYVHGKPLQKLGPIKKDTSAQMQTNTTDDETKQATTQIQTNTTDDETKQATTQIQTNTTDDETKQAMNALMTNFFPQLVYFNSSDSFFKFFDLIVVDSKNKTTESY